MFQDPVLTNGTETASNETATETAGSSTIVGTLSSSGNSTIVGTLTSGDELVVDNALPLSDDFDGDVESTDDETIGELIPLDVPVHFDGEETPSEHVEHKLEGFWDENLFAYNDFTGFYDYLVAFTQAELDSVSGMRNAQFEQCEGYTRDVEGAEREIERV